MFQKNKYLSYVGIHYDYQLFITILCHSNVTWWVLARGRLDPGGFYRIYSMIGLCFGTCIICCSLGALGVFLWDALETWKDGHIWR